MKLKKKTLFAVSLLFILLCLCLSGCQNVEKTDVETSIVQEMDKLKSLDASTAGKYISSETLFPDLSDGTLDQQLVEQFVSNFFKDFDYKILDIEVKDEKATASLRLNTLDAQKLAHDFSTLRLKNEILALSSLSTSSPTLSSNYQMLNSLMESNEYPPVENNCTMHLQKDKDTWNILRSDELENEIVGSFISYIADPNLLSPEETAKVYLTTMSSMEDEQLITYLGLGDILNTQDPLSDQITSALLTQALGFFDYELGAVTQNGYEADLDISFTTFDSEAILKEYESQMQKYLETPDALYAGQEGRGEQAHKMLLSCIENNTATTTLTVPMKLTNNGIFWALTNPNAIGSAIFGTVVDAWNEESLNSSADSSNTEEVAYIDSGYSLDSGYDDYSSDYDYSSDSSYDIWYDSDSDYDS